MYCCILVLPTTNSVIVSQLYYSSATGAVAFGCAGERYSNDRVQVQAGRSWGFERGCAIQPRIYAHPKVSDLQLPESGSVRVLAGQPVLSDLYVPSRQPVQVGTCNV